MTDKENRIIGFVGLGHMGEPMVARLLEGDCGRVIGFDADPAAAPGLDDRDRFSRASQLAELGAATVVILMLPSSDVVEEVVLKRGLLEALQPGALLVDMGSSEPLRTRRLGELVAERDATLVDAPVSGGVSGAEAGTLTVMVGGPAAACDAVRPLLEAVGSSVRRVGESGAGHAVKALNNLMSATHLLATSEALLAAQRFGLDLGVVLDVINGSSGRSGSTENKWPNFVLTDRYDSGFGLRLMVKDMRIALGLEALEGTPRQLSERAVELWGEAAGQLPADADHTEIVRWLQAAAGVRG